MASVSLSKVLDDAKVLSADEQRQLRDMLNAQLESSEKQKEEAVERALLQAGLLNESSAPCLDHEKFHQYQPVPLKGEPLSVTLLSERR